MSRFKANTSMQEINLEEKNPTYERHWISWPLQIVSPLPCREKKLYVGIYLFYFIFFMRSNLFLFEGVQKLFLVGVPIFFFFFSRIFFGGCPKIFLGRVIFFLLLFLAAKHFFWRGFSNQTNRQTDMAT